MQKLTASSNLLPSQSSGTIYSTHGNKQVFATPPPGTEPKEGGGFRLTTTEIQRRRTLNLCSYCGSNTHQVRNCEKKPDPSKTPQSYNSLNHLSNNNRSPFHMVPVTVHGPSGTCSVIALLDIGAESNFLSQEVVSKLGITTEGTTKVSVANGTNTTSSIVKDKTTIELESYPFRLSFISTPKLSFPVILGYSWWREATANIDFKDLSLRFTSQDKPRTIKLITHKIPKQEIVLNQINAIPDIKAELTILKKDKDGLPVPLLEFKDCFSEEECRELPPHRPYDIQINLKENSTPPWGQLIPLSDKDNSLLKTYINEELSKGSI